LQICRSSMLKNFSYFVTRKLVPGYLYRA
jgi:hypothetical protein